MFYRFLTLAIKWCLNKMYLIHLDNIYSPRFKGDVTWIHRLICSGDF